MVARTHSEYDELTGYESTGSGVAGKIFLWIAWALAAAFWAFLLTTAVGILEAADNPALHAPGGAGGPSLIGFLMMGGLVALGLAIAWGMTRWAGRDKSRGPLTEAATHAEYDMIEAAGGDDDVHRSPGERRPDERDAYRAVNP